VCIYYNYLKKKETLEFFPRFFQEIYNNTSSGMSLVEAIRKSKEGNYGRLTPLIRNMCLQIEWGTPFQVALENFGKKVNNKFIKKVITLTERASEFSTDVGKSMKEINEYIFLTDKLGRERSTELFPQLISLYFVFFVFLGIIFVIFSFFIPSFGIINILEYKAIFQNIILIEAVLSGITIGKITENSYLAGFKHLMVLLLVSIIFLFIFF
jgi:flagellar protein FlaJ